MSKSATIIDPIHPGEILKEEFLDELGLSATSFAKSLGVPANRVTRLIAGASSVTAQTALLLSVALDTSAEFWMNLQSRFDLETAQRQPETIARLAALAEMSPGGEFAQSKRPRRIRPLIAPELRVRPWMHPN